MIIHTPPLNPLTMHRLRTECLLVGTGTIEKQFLNSRSMNPPFYLSLRNQPILSRFYSSGSYRVILKKTEIFIRFVICIFYSLALTSFCQAESEKHVEKTLDLLFEKRKVELAGIQHPIFKLREQYGLALLRSREKAQAAGNLNGIEAADAAVKLHTDNIDIGDFSKDPEILKLQKIYQDKLNITRIEIGQKILIIEKDYSLALEKLVIDLTKTGQIEMAKKVRDFLQKTVSSDAILKPKPLPSLLSGGDNMVEVQGESMMRKQMLAKRVDKFWIGKFEVTWLEWKTVRDLATGKGYDIGDCGSGRADDHPVFSVNWYDMLKWFNAKSEIEGLNPCYWENGVVYRSGDFGDPDTNRVKWDLKADGYRLPSELEWEFAARGGTKSLNYKFSGSNEGTDAGWMKYNSGLRTKPVGQKNANELGLHDMTGNVYEACWDSTSGKRQDRGGGWGSPWQWCINSHSGSIGTKGSDRHGFRLARGAR